MLPAVLTAFLFAISAVCAGRSTKVLGGTDANFCRITIATLLLGIVAHTFGNGLSGQAFPIFFASGCVGFGIGDLALYQAFPRLGSRLCMVLVHCVAAPFAAVVEWLWLGTKITPFQTFCGALILIGIVIALTPGERTNISRRALLVGTFFGTIAGCGQGFGAVLSRKAFQVAAQAGEPTQGVTVGLTSAYQRIIAGWVIGTGFFALMRYLRRRKQFAESATTDHEGMRTPLRHRFRLAWPWVLGNALSGPSIGVSCFQWALATTPTAVVLPVVAVTPIVVMPFARFTEGDRPGLRSIAGGIVAVTGVVVLTWARLHS